VHESEGGYEFRFGQATGTIATVIERQSSNELVTTVKLNDVTTWVRRVSLPVGSKWHETVVKEFEYPTGKPLREERHWRPSNGGAIQAKAHRMLLNGGDAEATWESAFPRDAQADVALSRRPLIQTQGCSPQEVETLKTELRSAMRDGVACMVRYDRSDLAALLLSRYQRGPIVLACVEAADFVAAIDAGSYLGIIRPTKLSFDKATYFGRAAGGQTPTMAHELLHLWTGPHAPYIGTETRNTDQDRTVACASLCLADAKRVSKSDCAICLGVPVGDARCSTFVE
jgi:hypothetical protein